jgi:hypothetical protein
MLITIIPLHNLQVYNKTDVKWSRNSYKRVIFFFVSKSIKVITLFWKKTKGLKHPEQKAIYFLFYGSISNFTIQKKKNDNYNLI